jgi:tetratricopeptide (TPR) repeat protein
MRELAAGLALAAALNAALVPPPARGARGLPAHLAPDTAVETAAFVSLGLRRMEADLELIRMLVYYGSPEPEQQRREEEIEKAGGEGETLFGGGRYPEIFPRARRINDLDPKFGYAVLYAAGALAFNLDRPQQALDLLTRALERDPLNLQYQAYIAAVGFHRHGDMKRALEVLEPTLARPDCPTMIKSLVAFMDRRSGRRVEAARVYRDILATSRDAGYRRAAETALAELAAEAH